MTTERLIFFGTDTFSVPSLTELLAAGWNVVAIVTKPDAPTGRGRELTPPPVKRLAAEHGLPVLQPHRLTEALPQLKALGADAGIVVAYGKIIPPKLLNLFPKGLINVHASLLPRYRGASPIEAAILSGDETTGVTLMQLDAGMDTGPTYASAKLQLIDAPNRLELNEQLSRLGAELLETKLRAILAGTIVPIPQDASAASTVKLIQKTDGQIDWTKPAERLEREIRAYLGWPGSRTQLVGADVTITRAHTTPQTSHTGQTYRTPSGELAVYCGQGSLVIDQLKPAGKREMTGPEFLAGHPLPPG